jgi:uncharacterized DUF497 family protein
MIFEYDPNKSAGNKAKHGIDFEEARALWDDVERLEVPAAYRGEERIAIIGRIGMDVWTAIITYRGNATRIISVRRAREKEAELYENERIAD